MIRFHREGKQIILMTIAIVLALFAASMMFLAEYPVVLGIVSFLLLFFLVMILQFFRNPVKNTVINPKHIIAPADGKVVVIEEVEESEYFKDRRLQISIFMSPINVHTNLHPVTGKVEFFKYHPGKYLVAWHPKSSTENERTTTVVKADNGKSVLFRQIAGALAKRIVWYVKPGQAVAQGSEFGFIKFGSRVDVYLPIGTEVRCKLGDTTTGGETVIAEW